MSFDYSISYFDQNNNKYLISETMVIYEPVSLAHSSSGQNHGTTAFIKSMSAHKNLW
jgi:hypothetical protein